ncbi:PEGA domain-containing protein [Natronolimnobius sp. AArcel1]|uniref:PEGA domain-containing protein n=1 Tax=Natronolimnobius sp. AArcel1 TaxID=1679093 RepID=UPI0013EC0BEC|nr:PEGA domain-containing protein [Natronolimnobius sp. AArcel1]NGM67756.1 PEGA domain-containing protein [Natronolimnobius sp. AArcel1]
MGRQNALTRRRVASLLATGAVGLVAGCSDNGADDTETEPDDNGDDDDGADLETDTAETTLEIYLEDGDGESVAAEDVILELLDQETDIEYTIDQEIEDGVAEPDFTEPTTYTVSVVSDEYEDTEDEVTLDEGDDETLQFELEASS